MEKSRRKTWKDLIQSVIEKLPSTFALSDVLTFKAEISREYPDNRFIEAKIRQTLQVLRDQGALKFLGAGRYMRLDSPPRISLFIDPGLATGLHSRAQIARVTLETWAELNLYCLNCTSDRLGRLPANTILADFHCPHCDRSYQLKGKDGRFTGIVQGAAYGPLMRAAQSRSLPDYVLAEYDTRWSVMNWVRAIPGNLIDEGRIVARAALRVTAKRAGWIGATINVAGLPAVDLVAPRAEEQSAVRGLWRALNKGNCQAKAQAKQRN